jgi:Flp pilus assembly protein TadD
MLVLIRSRKYADAIRTGEETLAAGYRKAELYNLLAQAYDNGGKTQEAYDALRTATELEPQDETNYLDLMTLCVKHQNHELSLKMGDIGLRRIPRSHRLHLQLGVIFALQGQYDDAAREFKTSAQLAPDTALTQVALGLVLTQMGKLSEAIDLLRRQSVKSADDAEVFWFLGEALNQSGPAAGSSAEKEAIQALERSIQLNPTLSQPRALLGKIFLRRGQFERARN